MQHFTTLQYTVFIHPTSQAGDFALLMEKLDKQYESRSCKPAISCTNTEIIVDFYAKNFRIHLCFADGEQVAQQAREMSQKDMDDWDGWPLNETMLKECTSRYEIRGEYWGGETAIPNYDEYITICEILNGIWGTVIISTDEE